jgi:hypothetical protein
MFMALFVDIAGISQRLVAVGSGSTYQGPGQTDVSRGQIISYCFLDIF